MACKTCMYSKVNDSYTSTSFVPTSKNWLLSAQKGNSAVYFNSVSAFNKWSDGCCGTTRAAISTGNLNGYTILFNSL